MNIDEVLELCKQRNVEIYEKYDFYSNKFTVRVRRDNYCVERAFPYEDYCKAGFGLIIRISLTDMINEIDEAMGGKKNG